MLVRVGRSVGWRFAISPEIKSNSVREIADERGACQRYEAFIKCLNIFTLAFLIFRNLFSRLRYIFLS